MSVASVRVLRYGLAAGAALLLAAVAILRQAEVVARGNLLPVFESYEVTRVRMLGAELYVDRSAGLGDALTAAALALAAVVLLAAARHLDRPSRGAFVSAACGALFLAGDDLLSAHETLGHNLLALGRIPLVDHPDDAVLAAYAAVAAVFSWRHRALLRGVAPWPWLLAGGAGALAVAHDVSPLHVRAVEESLEALAAGAGLLGVIVLARHHVRSAGARPTGPGSAAAV